MSTLRIERSEQGCASQAFSTEWFGCLNGIMSQQEYEACIHRINISLYMDWWMWLVGLAPFGIAAIGVILFATNFGTGGGFGAVMILGAVLVVGGCFSMVFTSFFLKRKRKAKFMDAVKLENNALTGRGLWFRTGEDVTRILAVDGYGRVHNRGGTVYFSLFLDVEALVSVAVVGAINVNHYHGGAPQSPVQGLPQPAAPMPAGPPSIVHITSAVQYHQELKSAGLRLVAVDFTASWCAPCRHISPIFSQLSAQYSGRVVFLSVDGDANRELVQAEGITGFPTFHFYINGRKIEQFTGADEQKLRALIRTHGDRVVPPEQDFVPISAAPPVAAAPAASAPPPYVGGETQGEEFNAQGFAANPLGASGNYGRL